MEKPFSAYEGEDGTRISDVQIYALQSPWSTHFSVLLTAAGSFDEEQGSADELFPNGPVSVNCA